MRHLRGMRAGHRGAGGRPSARPALALAALAAAALGALAPSAARAAGGAAAEPATTRFAVAQGACAAPHPGAASCLAEIREAVRQGATGARPPRAAGPSAAGPSAAGPSAAGASAAGIGPAGGLTPWDLRRAYGLPAKGGAGQTVAIVDAYNDPAIDADLQAFDARYHLAACGTGNGCLRVVGQAGTATLPADDTSGWSVGEAEQVETVHAVCPGCKLILVEASSPANPDLATAEDTAVSLGADEVTNAFAEPESQTTPAFQAAFNHPGVVITAAAGNDGYDFYDWLAGTSQPSIPAAYPTTISVGGTSLYLGQDATRQSETVWNDNGVRDVLQQAFGFALGASGGGCSTLFSAPPWQAALSAWPGTGCGTMRLDNDVAAVGDYLTGFDIYDSYNCGAACTPATSNWLTAGGTALSSAVIAAAFALAGGAHGVAYPALTLYGHLGQAYDVTTGGNGWCAGQGSAQCPDPNSHGHGIRDCAYTAAGAAAAGDRACDALAGYDGPTGVGTPRGLAMFTPTGPSATIAGPATVAPGSSRAWNARPADPFPGGTVTRYRWNWGDGTSTVTTAATASHRYAAAGTRTITLTVTDSYGMTGTARHAVKVS